MVALMILCMSLVPEVLDLFVVLHITLPITCLLIYSWVEIEGLLLCVCSSKGWLPSWQ